MCFVTLCLKYGCHCCTWNHMVFCTDALFRRKHVEINQISTAVHSIHFSSLKAAAGNKTSKQLQLPPLCLCVYVLALADADLRWKDTRVSSHLLDLRKALNHRQRGA